MGAPGIIWPAKASAAMSVSGVFRRESASQVGTDRRPELTSARANGWSAASASTASRKVRLAALLGVMKSVERVELRMFSSAAAPRSSL
jgi:hypothetical protein